jgi:hypothetical protein
LLLRVDSVVGSPHCLRERGLRPCGFLASAWSSSAGGGAGVNGAWLRGQRYRNYQFGVAWTDTLHAPAKFFNVKFQPLARLKPGGGHPKTPPRQVYPNRFRKLQPAPSSQAQAVAALGDGYPIPISMQSEPVPPSTLVSSAGRPDLKESTRHRLCGVLGSDNELDCQIGPARPVHYLEAVESPHQQRNQGDR